VFPCLQQHQHGTAAERDGCDARMYDTLSLLKMARVGFTSPAKISRVTVYPAFKGVAETALPVDFLRSI